MTASSQGWRRPRTRERYQVALRCHVIPRLGRLRVAEITEDHVAWLIADMRAGVSFREEDGRVVQVKREAPLAGWTIRATLTPLSRLVSWCVRRGMATANPVAKLERGERPSVGRREMRILEREEIGRLLAATPERYRPLLATAVFTGLRLGELLGLTWADVDLDAGFVRVRKQLAKDGARVAPKTPQAVRDVVLMPALGRILREHKLRSPYSTPTDPVFASQAGTPLHWGNVARRGLEKAITDAGLDADGKPGLRFHDCRHTFASLLIAQGANVVFVSRQLGHANPSITLGVYAHPFDRYEHAQRTSELLEASFGTLVETCGGGQGRNGRVGEAALEGAEVVTVHPPLLGLRSERERDRRPGVED